MSWYSRTIDVRHFQRHANGTLRRAHQVPPSLRDKYTLPFMQHDTLPSRVGFLGRTRIERQQMPIARAMAQPTPLHHLKRCEPYSARAAEAHKH